MINLSGSNKLKFNDARLTMTVGVHLKLPGEVEVRALTRKLIQPGRYELCFVHWSSHARKEKGPSYGLFRQSWKHKKFGIRVVEFKVSKLVETDTC